MQGLVYIFIALAGLGVGAASFYALSFSVIEAILAAGVFAALAVVIQERRLRRRAESRLERGIQELSRLLSTDAQAGQVLNQRINAITELDAARRIDALEADMSVLGTVIRQVAEAVAELEENQSKLGQAPQPAQAAQPAQTAQIVPLPEPLAEPRIPLPRVVQGLEDKRLLCHIFPIVTLPQRRVHGYDVVPRLFLEDGTIAESADFMPRRNGEDLVRRIEGMLLNEALSVARRAKAANQSWPLHVPLSRATLANAKAIDQLLVALDAHRAVVPQIGFAITEQEFQALTAEEMAALGMAVKKGAGLSLTAARSLRLDFGTLFDRGVHSIRVDATRFVNQPEALTDIHSSDIASYIKRFGIELIVTGIKDERQIVSILEDGVGLAQGGHISPPGPARAETFAGSVAPRRAEL